MTVPTTIDAGAWIGNYLTGEDADGDLARAMLKAFSEAVMSAQVPPTTSAARTGRTRATAIAPVPGTPGSERSSSRCQSSEAASTAPSSCSPLAAVANRPSWR